MAAVPEPAREPRKRKNLTFGGRATAWEIADASLFFTSNESAYVTAQQLAVGAGIIGMS